MERALIGYGDFAKEVMTYMNNPTITCFVDDIFYISGDENLKKISEFNPYKYEVLVAIANPMIRYDIVKKLPKETKYFSYIHESSLIIGKDVLLGEGTIICPGSIVSIKCRLGNHSQVNQLTTIGHDSIIGDFFTSAPGVKISGNCTIGDRVYFGTNSAVKQEIKICDDVIIGLNCGVVKNITEPGTYIGTPAKKIK